jgi:hypothetical protein
MSTTTREERIADLTQDDHNANKGTARGADMVSTSLRRLGAGRSILVDRNGKIIAGNKTAREAAGAGIDDAIVVESDGSKLVVVQRTDLDLDTDPRARELAFADNRTAEIDLDYEAAAFTGLPEGTDLAWMYTDEEIALLAPTDSARAKEIAGQIASEEEYLEARQRADDLGDKVKSKLLELATKHPAALAQAVAVAIPTGTGGKLLLWTDRACADVLAEIQRYTDAGDASPLARLAEGMNPL